MKRVIINAFMLFILLGILALPAGSLLFLNYSDKPSQVLSSQNYRIPNEAIIEEDREELEMMCKKLFKETSQSTQSFSETSP